MRQPGACQRRAFLKGLGSVALLLPALQADLRSRVRADTASTSQRVVFLRHANGVAQANETEPEQFWPSALGQVTPESLQAEPDCTLNELQSYAGRMLLVRGTRYGFVGGVCGHQSSCAQLLTAADVDSSASLYTALGESVDFRLGMAMNPAGQEPLTLMTASADQAVLSYRGPRQKRAAENNPWNVYARMMGLGGTDDSAIAQLAAKRKSVNDLVRSEMKALLSRVDLTRDDRRRLDLHFSAIRDVEVKLACKLPSPQAPELDATALTSPDNYIPVTQLHMDLIALSFACDYSRVATLQLGLSADGTTHAIPGFRDGQRLPSYHRISHRMDSDGGMAPPIEGALAMHHQIDRLHARLFRYLLDKLNEYALPDARLLDHCLAVWASDLGDGPHHSFENLPWVIVGSGGGYLKQGAYVDAGGATHNRLLNTLINAAGVRKQDGAFVDDFGDARLEKGQIDTMLA